MLFHLIYLSLDDKYPYLDVLVSHLPPSPPLYPADEITDEPRAVMIGELVREAVLEDVR